MAKDDFIKVIILVSLMLTVVIFLLHQAIRFDKIHPNPLPTELNVDLTSF